VALGYEGSYGQGQGGNSLPTEIHISSVVNLGKHRELLF